jgi:hypothetical protein
MSSASSARAVPVLCSWSRRCENEQVSYEMVVLELGLLVANAFGGQRAASEGDRPDELIEAFALVCCGLDQPPQVDIGEIFEQEACTDHMTQFSKGGISLRFREWWPAGAA